MQIALAAWGEGGRFYLYESIGETGRERGKRFLPLPPPLHFWLPTSFLPALSLFIVGVFLAFVSRVLTLRARSALDTKRQKTGTMNGEGGGEWVSHALWRVLSAVLRHSGTWIPLFVKLRACGGF